MQIELKNMHKTLGITFIFVTHDQEEALTMSDKVVVMANGEIQQVGTPEEIYNEPANVFVADFIGESNIFNGVMLEDKKANFAGAVFQTVDDYPKGIKIDAVIRPEDVEVVDAAKGQITGTVTSADFKGTFYITFVQCGQYEMEVHCLDYYKPGSTVGLKVDPDNIHIIRYDDSINHYEGRITGVDGKCLLVKFADVVKSVPYESIFRRGTIEEGVVYDEDKNPVDLTHTKLEVYFEPSDAKLSDEIDKGMVKGKISSFYYIGDHYSYTVRSDSDYSYVVDDEYLWNQDDLVGVSIRSDKLVIKIVD